MVMQPCLRSSYSSRATAKGKRDQPAQRFEKIAAALPKPAHMRYGFGAFVQLTDDTICVGDGHAQFLCDLLYLYALKPRWAGLEQRCANPSDPSAGWSQLDFAEERLLS